MSDINPTLEPDTPAAEQLPSIQQKAQLPRVLRPFFLGGFAISLAIDLLFWQKPFGISYLIWVGVILLAALVMALIEHKKPHPSAYLLLAGALLTATLAVLRMETGTRVYNVLFSLLFLGLACDTLLTGEVFRFRVIDAVLRGVLTVFAAIERPISALLVLGESKKNGEHPGTWRTVWLPILRGVLLAVPVLLIFGLLLGSADPIFGQYLENFFEWLKIDDWLEFAFRVFYILVLGVLFSGLLLHAFSQKRRYHRPAEGSGSFKPFVGKIETYTVLGLVVLLFGAFLMVQMRYFFGGDTNINVSGYTYAEYARKGAEELIVVAVLALGLYQVLHTVTKLNSKHDRLILHILMTVLILEVLLMLLSSYQRLMLYETAYGFTRIRVRTHLFILWLAALLALVVLMEWVGKSDRFFPVLLAVSFGFVVSQGFLNIDQHIVQQNLARLEGELPADAWQELDHYHLSTLSDDAVPAMLLASQDNDLSALEREMFTAELSCRMWNWNEVGKGEDPLPWYAENPSTSNAQLKLADFESLPVNSYGGRAPFVTLSNGEEHTCYSDWYWD